MDKTFCGVYHLGAMGVTHSLSAPVLRGFFFTRGFHYPWPFGAGPVCTSAQPSAHSATHLHIFTYVISCRFLYLVCVLERVPGLLLEAVDRLLPVPDRAGKRELPSQTVLVNRTYSRQKKRKKRKYKFVFI